MLLNRPVYRSSDAGGYNREALRMDNRRTFLKLGLSACAAGAISLPTSARGIVVPPYYKAVFDERFKDACTFAAAASQRGIPTGAIRGDITNLFYSDLDLRWKQGPVLLTGYTTPASLFCLDLLARDRGMRVSHCVSQPGVAAALSVLDGAQPMHFASETPAQESSALIFWIIAPNSRIEA